MNCTNCMYCGYKDQRAAVKATRNRKVGVIGTYATVLPQKKKKNFSQCYCATCINLIFIHDYCRCSLPWTAIDECRFSKKHYKTDWVRAIKYKNNVYKETEN